MRKLATIVRVDDINPIKGADNIEVATVRGWRLVVQKGEFKVGDKAVYCEIDSMLPIKPEFEFLRKSCYKKMSDGTEGFRIRTMKMLGQVSQGILFPLDILGYTVPEAAQIGDDVTDYLGIKKYEPPTPACLSGKIRGMMPSFIKKTDEERVQNLVSELEYWKGSHCYISEKVDGSSCTIYLKDGDFGVCGRKLNYLEYERGYLYRKFYNLTHKNKKDFTNSYWKVVRKYGLENKMRNYGGNFAIQGELYGEGIQGNRYKVKGQHLALFSVFDIDAYAYRPLEDLLTFSKLLEVNTVPIIEKNFGLYHTVDELVELSKGRSVLYNTEREGIVIRALDSSFSFKAINPKYLVKHKL